MALTSGRYLQAVFLDRDGTIGGSGAYTHPRDFVPYPFAAAAIALLKRNGLMVFAFTNQTHLADGDASMEEYVRQFALLGFDRVLDAAEWLVRTHRVSTPESRRR